MADLPTIQAIRDQLSANLVISARVSQMQGSFINVGEEFTVTFQVSNDLLYVDAKFTDVWLFVSGTSFAVPKDGSQVSIDLGEIPARSAKSAEVKFKALQKMPGILGPNFPTPFADARVRAQFDIQQLFTNIWQEKVFFTQIYAG
jgi:hypothetical protein